MSWVTHFAKSSIGAKMLMAVTGMGLVLFAIAHMLGNLQVFLGPEKINAYGDSLRSTPALLWTARIGLLVMFVVHIVSALRLASANRAARPVQYAVKKNLETSYAALTMRMSGLIFFAFVAFHLAHYTFLVTHQEFQTFVDGEGRHDVYRMVVAGFQQIPISILYIFAVGLICAHMSHGIPSFMQSLGVRHPKYTPAIRKAGPIIALLLFIGFVSVPIAVMAGVLDFQGGA